MPIGNGTIIAITTTHSGYRENKVFLKKRTRNESTDEDWEHINNVSVQKNAKCLAAIRVSACEILPHAVRTEFLLPLVLGERAEKQHFQHFQNCTSVLFLFFFIPPLTTYLTWWIFWLNTGTSNPQCWYLWRYHWRRHFPCSNIINRTKWFWNCNCAVEIHTVLISILKIWDVDLKCYAYPSLSILTGLSCWCFSASVYVALGLPWCNPTFASRQLGVTGASVTTLRAGEAVIGSGWMGRCWVFLLIIL